VSVATTYAEALFEAAVEQDAVEAVASDVAAFAQAMRESAELRAVLSNPEVERRAKKAALAALTEDAHPLTANFLQVLVDRGRMAEFPEVARAFQERVARAEHRLEVEAVTAVPMPDDLRKRVVQRIQGQTGATVELSEAVDPDIVGGLVLRIGGVVVDGSLRRRLEELRHTLRAAPVDAAAVESS
jgi:F-type H+-transporting ATPase subunit delta